MLYAIVNGNRVPSTPGAKGGCTACQGVVHAKCGSIKIWHWAHEVKDCDPWYEPESQWHQGWKALVPLSRQEVVMGAHRADIVGGDGTVIELQHSSISPEEIKERQDFYKRMVWLVDGAPFLNHLSFREKAGYWTFRWKYPRRHHEFFSAPLFWDFGGCGHSSKYQIFKVNKLERGRGWGTWWSQQEFVTSHMSYSLFESQAK